MSFNFGNQQGDGDNNFNFGNTFNIKDFKKPDINVKKLKKPFIIIGIIILFIILAVIAANIYLEIIQYNEIGNLSSIYTTNLLYKVLFGVVSFIFIFAAFSVTNIFINKNMRVYRSESGLAAKRYPNYIISAILAFIGALICQDTFYSKAISFLNSVGFGKEAPVVGQDVGYYIFQRPFLMGIYDFISTLWILIIAYTLIYYVISVVTSMDTSDGFNIKDSKYRRLIRHNIINVAIFFIIKAVSYKFQREGVLYSTVVNTNGASWVDVNIWLNYFTVAPFLLLAIVIAAFFFVWKGKLKRAAIVIAVFPVCWLLVTIGATAYQSFIVKPNEVKYESEYLKYNMEQTREAYKIDQVKRANFPTMKELSTDIINKNINTVNNIRVVDYPSTLESNTQLQSNTNFYSFQDGDIINYNINGKEIPIFITAREIDKNKLPENANTYINKNFKYTHGYGIVINPINSVTSQGQVNFILNGLDMVSTDKNLVVKKPGIYYGELTKDDVIVKANGLKEIDYDGVSKSTVYDGKGGIKMNFLNKVLFALKNQDLNMLISGYISSDSKLLINRDIIARAQKAVPFLKVDEDPYILLMSDGSLKWVLDAYTYTDKYPYSQNASQYGNFNYIRNSVKITIDAYDGTVKYYIIDQKDPIVKMYDKAYPNLFSKDSLPKDVVSHMRYPELMFKIQSEVLRKYHLDPNTGSETIQTFYDNSDKWDIAKSNSGSSSTGSANNNNDLTDMDPYYNMVKLPNENNNEELVLMRPFTPSNKHNMISWLAARSNSLEYYGQLVLYNFPKNKNIYGPYQVEGKINQIDQVSKDKTLWGQGGSNVYMGNLLVIPIEDTVLYVEPIYIKSASKSAVPEVKKIVVGYQVGEEFRYGTGSNLDEAIKNLFTGANTNTSTTPNVPQPNQTPTDNQPQTQPNQNPQTNTGTIDKKVYDELMKKYDEMKKQIDEMGKLIDQLKP